MKLAGNNYILAENSFVMPGEEPLTQTESNQQEVISNPFEMDFVDWMSYLDSHLGQRGSADYFEVGKTLARAATRKKTDIDTYYSRNFLPLSGRTLSIKQSKDNEFRIQIHLPQDQDSSPYPQSNDLVKKWSATKEEAETLFKALRLSQMMLQAHRHRSEGIFIITSSLKDMLEVLEDYVDDSSSNYDELRSSLKQLLDYVRIRVVDFHNQLKLQLGQIEEEEFNFHAFFDKYCLIPEEESIDPRKYGLGPTRDDILNLQRTVMHNAIQSLFKLNTPRNPGVLVKVETVPINLSHYSSNSERPNSSEPYKSVIDLAEQISPAISDQKTQKILDDILHKATQTVTLKSLIENSPDSLNERLEKLMIDHELEHVMELQLNSSIPGPYSFEKRGDKKIHQIYKESAKLRGRIALLEGKNAILYEDIQALRAGRDVKSDIDRLNTTWGINNENFTACSSTEKSVDDALVDLETVEKLFNQLKNNLKRIRTNVSTDGSVLWLGLGQAGGQILRECLMYCLDNLNDARCSALVQGLGIHDQKRFQHELLQRKHPNPEIREIAEQKLLQMCHQDLHILAMNLGGEVDDLVAKGEPGYFLWGDEYAESENSSVRRKCMNTIKLDIDQDGAGGKTGMGRAYGFTRQPEIEEAFNEVGHKGGRSPDHIIVTHSFAGGSGSGMVLPVLQMLRSQFDSDTMIWVISVGTGASEAKVSAAFNTPFIMSDILQAHYDGIHSPMEPFNLGEWKAHYWGLGDLHGQMAGSLNELNSILGWDVEKPFLLELENITPSLYQEQSRRRSHHQKLSTSPFHTDGAISAPNSDDTDGLYTVKELLDMLPSDEPNTTAFNDWCGEFDELGRRPALTFWYNWAECMSDPIGSLLSAKEEGKQTGNNSTDDIFTYSPNITLGHIELLKKHIIQRFPALKDDADEVVEKNLRVLPKDLTFIRDPLLKKLSELNPEEMKEQFSKISTILNTYGMRLESFNKIRRDLTKRIQALSKSSNDIGIKNIIVSNAHLERGVKNSGIEVEEATYTVYNAVIFDLIMNIIGSQLPSDDYISGKMEYFDRQDLSNHTKPPMVVGLMQLEDSISLGETFHSKDGSLYSEIRKMFGNIFISTTSVDGLENPFEASDFEIAGGPTYLLNSFFGVRLPYMLQHNPYDLMGYDEPAPLSQLVQKVESLWGDFDGSVFGNTLNERNSLKKQGFTGLNFANMLRWLTTIDPNTLNEHILAGPKVNIQVLQNYRVQKPGLDLKTLRISPQISDYASKSGKVDLTLWQEILPKLGIWSEEVFAAMAPSYLNSFLIPGLLNKSIEQVDSEENLSSDEKELCGYVLEKLQKYFKADTLYDHISQPAFEELAELEEYADADPEGFAIVQKYLGKRELYFDLIDAPVGSDKQKILVLRLHPRVHRYLSVVRDSTSGPYLKILPSQSVPGSIARYLSADSPSTVIGQYSAPKFSKALDKLNRLRYIGLLPGELDLNLSSYLRIAILCAAKSGGEIQSKLCDVAKSGGIEILNFDNEVAGIVNENLYDESYFTVYNDPRTIVGQTQMLKRRILATEPFIEKFTKNRPESRAARDFWVQVINCIRDEPVQSEEEMRYMLQKLQNIVRDLELPDNEGKQDENSSEPHEENQLEPDSSKPGEDILDQIEEEESSALEQEINLQVRRLIFDIVSVLNESLTQAEYMSKNHSTERVHFHMSGFSDRIIGRPSGLLIQVHTNNSSRGDTDSYRIALRDSISATIGTVKDTKEFFTKSHFGPAASVTSTLQQAPVYEAANHFREALRYMGGNDPDSYIEKTKLHPYVFLYNMLWLSARIETWTSKDNVAFARKFIVPSKVITRHYSDPNNIKGAADILVKDAIFQGAVEVPRADIRDYEWSKNPQEKYRSMRYLVSIMAYRHVIASTNEDIALDEYLAEIENLKQDLSLVKIAGDLPAEALQTETKPEGNLTNKKLSPIAKAMKGKQTDNADDLQSRTLAWLSAYKAWSANDDN